jgi:hypothetical protein
MREGKEYKYSIHSTQRKWSSRKKVERKYVHGLVSYLIQRPVAMNKIYLN